MVNSLSNLVEVITPEKIDGHIYRGQSLDLGYRSLYGGHVLAQALASAHDTVLDNQIVHSLHSYFILPGSVDYPVLYIVDLVRDGKRYSNRRVRAIQNGKEIFMLTASFQIPEAGYDHQQQKPELKTPECLAPFEERFSSLRIRGGKKFDVPHGIDVRPVSDYDWAKPEFKANDNSMWLRAKHKITGCDYMHQCILAYASDFNFLSTSLMPHKQTYFKRFFQIATIDHSIWFHRPFRMDKWLLHEVHSVSASSGRGLVKGNIYTEEGIMIASTMQEGVIRDLNNLS